MGMEKMSKEDGYLGEEIEKYKDGCDGEKYGNVNDVKWVLERG